MSDLTIRVDSEEYVLRRGDDGLQVGRQVGGEVAWLDTVDLDLLPRTARDALTRGDAADASLVTAVRGVVQAEVERGG
jgi:hypothetical protein